MVPLSAGSAAAGVRVPHGLSSDLFHGSALGLVFLMAMGLLVWDAAVRPVDKRPLFLGSLATVLAALGLTIAVQAPAHGHAFAGMVHFDAFGAFFCVALLIAAALSLLISPSYLDRVGVPIGEYYPLCLFGLFGAMAMSIANDLILVFVALEVMSIAFYVLTGIQRERQEAVESAFKYFLLGAFSSAILLYGISLLYGATETTNLSILAAQLRHGVEHPVLAAVGCMLVLVGFGFKVAAVPFHMWTPDVYQGAPSPVTAFMATAVKAASFAAFVRILMVGFPSLAADWGWALWAMAALTMLLGNVAALVQDDLKRMLAYSSIAHAGYLLMALVASDGGAAANRQLSGVLFYLLAYVFMNLGAFAVVSTMTKDGEDRTYIDGLRGLGTRRPWMAAGLALCLLSLAGIPPTMGFVGKFYLFAATVSGGHVVLAVIGALSAAIGVYYYLRPIVVMYMSGDEGGLELHVDSATRWALGISCAMLVVFGLLPGELLQRCLAGMMSLG